MTSTSPLWRSRKDAVVNRYPWLLVLSFITIATIRIVSTYYVFSFTSDEPAHIAAGMEWLDKGTYVYDQLHPPLARIAEAIPLYIEGKRSQKGSNMWTAGWAILNSDEHHKRSLALARLGNLPFFWLAAAMMYLLSRRLFGTEMALVATFLFTFVPGVLAHAGLATTDMALTAMYGAVIYIGLWWLENPSYISGLILGLAVGLALLSKFSAFAFLPAAALTSFVFYLFIVRPRPRPLAELVRARVLPLLIAALVATFLMWAGYRFSFSRIPAPELFGGIQELRAYQGRGHQFYLLGQREIFWPYYLVVLSVKTPLALLALSIVGAVWSWRHRFKSIGGWISLALVTSVLGVALYSKMNDGIRHILVIFFPMCMLAAVGLRWMAFARRTAIRWTAAGLLLWFVVASIASHPDYLPYFNELAGRHPEKILADSDLDWGQDMYRLADRLKQVGATEVAMDPLFIKYPQILHDFPPLVALDPDSPKPGWNAVSIGLLKMRRELFFNYPRANPWAERLPPTERVGHSVLLWYVPSNDSPTKPDAQPSR